MSPQVADQSDEALMLRAQADDPTAFAQLYDRHSVKAFRVAVAVCRDTGQAEDTVQESFLTIWRNRANYRPDMGRFQAWSMRIVRNRAIDSYRSAAVRPPAQREGDEEISGPSFDPTADEVNARGSHRTLLTHLKGLPDAQAEVIVLSFFGELSHAEIAAELDLPEGTVKGRMRLGLDKLRRRMDAA